MPTANSHNICERALTPVKSREHFICGGEMCQPTWEWQADDEIDFGGYYFDTGPPHNPADRERGRALRRPRSGQSSDGSNVPSVSELVRSSLALKSNSGPPGIAIKALTNILGQEPTHKELLALRMGLFNNIMPNPTRAERRSKLKNIEKMEEYADSIVRVVSNKATQKEIVRLALSLRREREGREILMHAIGI